MRPRTLLPNLLRHRHELVRLSARERLGLIVDFDGTIAEIAPTPEQAVVRDEELEILDRLSRALALVAVVSGRSAPDLEAKVGLGRVTYVGNHGAEYLVRDRVVYAEGADEYADRIAKVFGRLRESADGPGLIWQDKGLSASVHYRLAPDHKGARRRLAAALDLIEGAKELEVFWGKLVMELRSPLGLHKGFAVRKLVADHSLDGVLFLGDDTTDVDGMHAVRKLAEEGGLAGLGVAVLHEDSPAELLAAASYSLDGVTDVRAVLRLIDELKG